MKKIEERNEKIVLKPYTAISGLNFILSLTFLVKIKYRRRS